MTCVEFFDNNAIENIFTCLTVKPDRVILIGDKGKTLEKHALRYKAITDEAGYNIEYMYCVVPRNNSETVMENLESIIEQYDDCIFDLTGGDNVYLFAAGRLAEKYRGIKNIQMHRVNYLNNAAYDMDGDDNVISSDDMPKLSVRDCVRIYGGEINEDEEQFDAVTEQIKDLNAIWNICRQDPITWNKQISVLAAIDAETDYDDPLKTIVPDPFDNKRVFKDAASYSAFSRMIDKLSKAGLISANYQKDGRYYVIFKNETVKECLTVSGRALELQIYVAALNYRDKKGELFYNDVRQGVVIDWDGDMSPDSVDTINEIDVMMIRGVVPVFVSCKNGRIKSDELYKLNTVAARFGGKYGKKVLAVTGQLDVEGDAQFVLRAKELGIKIMDGLCAYDEKGILKLMKQFW